MYDAIVQHVAHRVECQDISAQVRHSDVSGQTGSRARTARSTSDEPNLIQNERGTTYMSIADGDDEDPMGIENSQLEQAPSSLSIEDHVRGRHGMTRVRFAQPPKGTHIYIYIYI